jgi:DNA polymerase III subunit gamma/tau
MAKANYQVIARKYRPQTFDQVLGQEAIVTTLKNAIKNRRLAHAYLFCGSRGTGKTTLARIFAKTLNCLNLTEQGEPCNECTSCREITSGCSLDVLEIDGASHRGIDDVRQINETVGYAAPNGGYKIYIIDEVHMLTKEAFNALLKTLEEPPAKVLFFFATTEPHKVLPTILSRCQRFNLNRIPTDKIIKKLKAICGDLDVEVQDEALRIISNQAEGGLRDAESLLDQMISFYGTHITVESVTLMLGLMPQDSLFALDQAGKEGNLAIAFEIAHEVFSKGKNLVHFIESLTEHFRTILMVKMSGKTASFLTLTQEERSKYELSAKIYSQEQILNILDDLIASQQQIRFSPSPRIALEAILLRILRSHRRLPIEYLVRRLTELEQSLQNTSPEQPQAMPNTTSVQPQMASILPAVPPQKPPAAAVPLPTKSVIDPINIDPTPTKMDFGIKDKKEPPPKSNEPPPMLSAEKQQRLDTLLQFAAVELEGTIHKIRM